MDETTSQRLAQPLDAARVKMRDSGRGGQKLAYLETHDVIRTANDVFGFGKWGHEIVELRPIEPVTVTNRDGKAGLQVGYICIVKLTVAGSVPVSGVGYGDAVEYRESAPVTAHELAAKEAESDALKRALKNFGDQFGLALYDKQAATNGHVVRNGSGNGEAAMKKAAEKAQGGLATTEQREQLAGLAADLIAAGKLTEQQIASAAGTNPDDGVSAAVFAGITKAKADNLIERLTRYAQTLEKTPA